MEGPVNVRPDVEHHLLLEPVVDQDALVIGIIPAEIYQYQRQDEGVQPAVVHVVHQAVDDHLDQPGRHQVQQGG